MSESVLYKKKKHAAVINVTSRHHLFCLCKWATDGWPCQYVDVKGLIKRQLKAF